MNDQHLTAAVVELLQDFSGMGCERVSSKLKLDEDFQFDSEDAAEFENTLREEFSVDVNVIASMSVGDIVERLIQLGATSDQGYK